MSSRQRREPWVTHQSHFKTQHPNLVIPTTEGTLRQKPISLQNPTTLPCHPDYGGNPASKTNLTSKPNNPTLSSRQRREPCIKNQSHFKTQHPKLVIPTKEGTLSQKTISLQNPTSQTCHPDKGGNPESENNLTSKPNIPTLSSRRRREPWVRKQSHFKTQQPNSPFGG